MGNKSSKGKGMPANIEPESEEYWWWHAEKTLTPIDSCEEFCERFKSTPEVYNGIVEEFNGLVKKSFPDDPSKDYISYEGWLTMRPGEPNKKCLDLIWKGFDLDSNGKITLDEFLVFQGISTAGTLEQKAMGSFWMLDQNHDHKIGRDEIALLMRASGEASGASHSDEEIGHLSDFVLKFVDKDKNGSIELSELISVARSDEKIADIFRI